MNHIACNNDKATFITYIQPLQRMEATKKRTIVVASIAELREARYYRLLLSVLRELQKGGLSRRKMIEAATMIFLTETIFVYSSGKLFPIPDFDEVFPKNSDRWLSEILRTDATGENPKHSQSQLYDRLRLLDALVRYGWPHKIHTISEVN